MECAVQSAHELACQGLTALLACPLASARRTAIPPFRSVTFLTMAPFSILAPAAIGRAGGMGEGGSATVAGRRIRASIGARRLVRGEMLWIFGGNAPVWCLSSWYGFAGRPRGPGVMVRPQHDEPGAVGVLSGSLSSVRFKIGLVRSGVCQNGGGERVSRAQGRVGMLAHKNQSEPVSSVRVWGMNVLYFGTPSVGKRCRRGAEAQRRRGVTGQSFWR